MKEEPVDTHSKALRINVDPRWYGTFAEIGAGQEVVRWFFRVGGAAGTIAKSISAYDMKVSDAIYGHAERYVSRGRLQAMLDRVATRQTDHRPCRDRPVRTQRDRISQRGQSHHGVEARTAGTERRGHVWRESRCAAAIRRAA